MTIALILSGGGARAAYQVGVLRAVMEIIEADRQPFKIICGTSAGAINAAYFTSYAHRPRHGLVRLHHVWRRLKATDVYNTSWFSVARSMTRMSIGALRGGVEEDPTSLLDNAPLEQLLSRWIDFAAVRSNLQNGVVRNLCITGLNYSTGESIAFYEGAEVEPWHRTHRSGVQTTLSLDHIMASAAIPILFPPRVIDNHYYGDGALRQLNPLSPALHLGADKLFVIGVSSNRKVRAEKKGVEKGLPPTIAQMAGHLLNREFIDNLEADIERAEVINMLINDCALSRSNEPVVREVDIYFIIPSIPFDEIAVKYIHRQPASMRLLFRLIGARAQGAGASFASFLLFDGGFCAELSDMGYRDAYDNADSIRKFFS